MLSAPTICRAGIRTGLVAAQNADGDMCCATDHLGIPTSVWSVAKSSLGRSETAERAGRLSDVGKVILYTLLFLVSILLVGNVCRCETSRTEREEIKHSFGTVGRLLRFVMSTAPILLHTSLSSNLRICQLSSRPTTPPATHQRLRA